MATAAAQAFRPDPPTQAQTPREPVPSPTRVPLTSPLSPKKATTFAEASAASVAAPGVPKASQVTAKTGFAPRSALAAPKLAPPPPRTGVIMVPLDKFDPVRASAAASRARSEPPNRKGQVEAPPPSPSKGSSREPAKAFVAAAPAAKAPARTSVVLVPLIKPDARVVADARGSAGTRSASLPPRGGVSTSPANVSGAVPPAARPGGSAVQVKTIEEFTKWCEHYPDSNWAVVKGWANNGPSRKSFPASKLCYNPDALSRLDSYSRIIWDGSNLNRTGHSAVVADFLRAKGHRKAVAFIKSDQVDVFKKSWDTFAAEFAGCVIAVAVNTDNDLDPIKADYRMRTLSSEAQESFRINRLAMKLTSSQKVICMGGAGPVAHEAEASLGDGVQWTVFALSRGSKETEASLLDWAATKRSAQVELVTGADSTEANGYFSAAPPAPKAVAPASSPAAPAAAKAGSAVPASKPFTVATPRSGAVAAPSAMAGFASQSAPTAPSAPTFASARSGASPVLVKTVAEFTKWCEHYESSKWAVVKGWANNGPSRKSFPSSKLCYNADALSRLDKFSRVIWDGSNLNRTGHSAVVADFLRAKGHRKAVAFIKSDDMDVFKRSWEALATELGGCVIAVAVDMDNDLEPLRSNYRVSNLSSDAQDSFRINRLAMKLTGVQNVICMGGAGPVAQEAEVSLGDGVQWTVFALSRGSKETEASLLDWAATKRSAQVELVTGADGTEANGYFSVATPAPKAATPAVTAKAGAVLSPAAKAGFTAPAPKPVAPAPPLSGSAAAPSTLPGLQVKTVAEFSKWSEHHQGSKWGVVKGWATGPSMKSLPSSKLCYNADALSRLDSFSRIIWDGSNLNRTGHSAVVADFLRAKSHRKAVAFVKSVDMDVFKRSWGAFAAENPNSVIVVAVNMENDLDILRRDAYRVSTLSSDAQDSFRLGMLALKLTGAQNVISMGGGASIAQEADASLRDGVQWTVYGLSRGSKETESSLLDWAATKRSAQLEFVTGSDSTEANGYASEQKVSAAAAAGPAAAKAGSAAPAATAVTLALPKSTVVAAPSAKAGTIALATNARGTLLLAPRPTASAVKVQTVDQFVKWCGNHHYADGKWAAVKGWANGPSTIDSPNTKDCYNADALSRFDGFLRVVWDGSNTGHGALVADFLKGSAVKERKIVAFIKSDDVDVFKRSWEPIAAEHPGCVIAVAIDVEKDLEAVRNDSYRFRNFPADAQDSFRIGRLAMKLTSARNVVCMGGDGSVAQEAEASLGSGVQWTIYALSRFTKETEPSLLDWAATARSTQVEFITGSDSTEANGFLSAPRGLKAATASPAAPTSFAALTPRTKAAFAASSPTAVAPAPPAAPLPKSLQILADMAAKKASVAAATTGSATAPAAKAGAAVRGASVPPIERFGTAPKASPAVSNRSCMDNVWTGIDMPGGESSQFMGLSRMGLESDLAGLRALAEAAPELRRFKGWFGAGDPKTASDLEGWAGVSASSGRVTDIDVQMSALHEGVGRLSALRSLSLTASSNLETLPDSLGNLARLTTLKLSNCPKLAKLPDSIGDLKQLKVLDVSNCKALGSTRQGAALPRTVSDLAALETLKLNGCEILTRLPPGFCNLTSLVTLEMQGCINLTALPAKLAELPNLKKLDVRGCTGIGAVPKEGVLGRLTAAGCTVLV